MQGVDPRLESQDVDAVSIGNDRVRSGAKAKKIDIASDAAVERVASAAAIKRVVAGQSVKLVIAGISDQEVGGVRTSSINGAGALEGEVFQT